MYIFYVLYQTYQVLPMFYIDHQRRQLNVGQNHIEEVSKIIEEKYWVNPEDVSAYQLLTDGTAIDILDKEEGMIESDRIDEVSKTLNEEFDLLQNIELGIEQNG